MHELPANLASHLDGDATTICNAWRLTRTDGTVLGFTDHDRELEFDGTKFAPDSGFLPGAARSELGLNVDDGEVSGAFSSDAITEEDLAAGRYDGAKVEVFLLNWQDPQSALKLRSEELGEVSYSQHIFKAELRSLAHKLNQPQGRSYSRKCGADLGDNRCKVNLDNGSFKTTGEVSNVIDERTFEVINIGSFDQFWFRHGVLTWTSGANLDLSIELHDHFRSSGRVVFRMFSPAALAVQVGDTFLVTAGCDKTKTTCQSKFSNIINFQGFPHLPGSDFAYGYADEDTVHDGRILVE